MAKQKKPKPTHDPVSNRLMWPSQHMAQVKAMFQRVNAPPVGQPKPQFIRNQPKMTHTEQQFDNAITGGGVTMIAINRLIVDVNNYQRLTPWPWAYRRVAANGFDFMACGAIDVACYPDGTMAVWDGAGRVAMAELAGITHLPAMITHCDSATAALAFVMRNGYSRRASGAQNLKAQVHGGALITAQAVGVLTRVGLSLAGVNPGFPQFGTHREATKKFLDYLQRPAVGSNPTLPLERACKLMLSVWPSQDIPTNISGGLIELMNWYQHVPDSDWERALQHIASRFPTTVSASAAVTTMGTPKNKEPQAGAFFVAEGGYNRVFKDEPVQTQHEGKYGNLQAVAAAHAQLNAMSL